MRAYDKCKSDLKVNAEGKYPLEVAMLDLYTSPEVVFHLLPTPGGSSRKRSRSKTPPRPKPNKNDKGSPPRNNPKGNGKNKKKAERVLVPNSLKGYSGVNAKKMRICYNYNLPHGCSNSTHVKEGQTRCVKGVHQCIKCHKMHPLQECGKGGN